MFKKLKDKLAEEVKSSPQRIQQFAQAAQAAVTSASSSISDITNNDLFSIGDSDSQKTGSTSAKPQQSAHVKDAFQDISLSSQAAMSLAATTDPFDGPPNSDVTDNQRQRRLSNSSFASDVSFKLPSYESTSMYHLQSDMDVSASEAEERGLASPGGISLERVTKEQLYAAYRRTQDKYGRYRTRYADLARHYKLLERDNAKARSVLVETQDKALRRISELREQCGLEQSAKAHLERALQMDIDEKNIKIETLTTKIKLLQSNNGTEETENSSSEDTNTDKNLNSDAQLIDLTGENDAQGHTETVASEISGLNIKIEKMEQLLNKYKESLKGLKEKNSHLTTELQVVTNDLQNKTKENEQLKITTDLLTESRQKIQELKDINEELQNKINTYDFSKSREISTLETDFEKAKEKIKQLQNKIDTFNKREEDYAISLAENKLSIHKELESKETEIKSLKDSLSTATQEVQSLNIVVNDYKNKIRCLEDDKSKLNSDINELNVLKSKLLENENELKELKQKCQTYEQSKAKRDEEYKCLELQCKQETAEKLAVLDRNAYLENRNKQISEDNAKVTNNLTMLQNELQEYKNIKSHDIEETNAVKDEISNELNIWKDKCKSLELEIQEERVELAKLQTEIEKLLTNYDLAQEENSKLNTMVKQIKSDNLKLQKDYDMSNKAIKNCIKLKNEISNLRNSFSTIRHETKQLDDFKKEIKTYADEFSHILKSLCHKTEIESLTIQNKTLKDSYSSLEGELNKLKDLYNSASNELNITKEEQLNLQNTFKKNKEELNSITASNQQLQDMNKKLAESCKELESAKTSFDLLNKNLEERENDLMHTNQTLQQRNDHIKLKQDELESLKLDNQVAITKLKEQENISSSIADELSKIKREHEDNLVILKDLKLDKSMLEKSIKELTDENTSLKKNIESLVDNFKTLEKELAAVRLSHTEIEVEKDRLNSFIESFEKNERIKNTVSDSETQTTDDFESLQKQFSIINEENSILKSKCEQIKQEKEELYEKLMSFEQKKIEIECNLDEKTKALENYTSLKSKLAELETQHENLKSEFVQLNRTHDELKSKLSEEAIGQYDSLKKEYDALKDENRRFQSDIEGLQTYLAKISKENSTLNDKLRETIASSENFDSHDSPSTHQDITNLKMEIEYEREKNADLTRQNALLNEENLELKDQVLTQNFVPSLQHKIENSADPIILNDQYNHLLKVKQDLEKKLADSEVMSRSADSNMKQLQENNQKLRSSNDKLERRLDEALVSLRHLHSLQENTELEYLRNILYEYLTGSGTHSVTLAKVLSAVVKFDDKQTQQILQKEKERQGLLRQLGLL
ncbi:golgin subfamily A member 4 [Plutella xylostella]|uniref:golgin subfamily A member 4 n=1 Tax=Plutella xylostella TaxID=51655 RepID=UPI00203264C3|nr:golgin subfamily A member 4 [Plutella xylostella]